MGRQQPRTLIKLIEYLMFHRPDEFGLFPNRDGSYPVKEVLKALHEEEGWRYLRLGHLRELGFADIDLPFRLDGDLLRPQGREPFALVQDSPPRLLYYGARRREYPVIRSRGVHAAAREFLPLGTTAEMAERLGRRRDPEPVIVTVHTRAACDDGRSFWRCGDLLYLVPSLPANSLHGPVPREETETKRKPRGRTEHPRQSVPEPLILRPEHDPDPQRRWRHSKEKEKKHRERSRRQARRQRKRGRGEW